MTVKPLLHPTPWRGVTPLRVGEPHDVMDGGDRPHFQPAWENIGGRMEQIDTL
ncbi:hypothetical protein QPK87_24310 [Kamptonema cortianum]|nr:hypothetical protein [Kamptonema cortianum]